MKRRSNIKVEDISTDMGVIEIDLRPDNTFSARVGSENVFAASMEDIKSLIHKRVVSLLHVDFIPVIEIQGSTLRDSHGSYITEDSIRTSFYTQARRYHLGVRSNDGGKTRELCRIEWDDIEQDSKVIASSTRDYCPFSWAARQSIGISNNGRMDITPKTIELFMNPPAIYVSPQGFEFEILVNYSSDFWEFLKYAHTTTMKLFDRIRETVSSPDEIKRIEASFSEYTWGGKENPKLTP